MTNLSKSKSARRYYQKNKERIKVKSRILYYKKKLKELEQKLIDFKELKKEKER